MNVKVDCVIMEIHTNYRVGLGYDIVEGQSSNKYSSEIIFLDVILRSPAGAGRRRISWLFGRLFAGFILTD
jgi:hypothetical protein